MVWRLSNGDLVLDDVGCCWNWPLILLRQSLDRRRARSGDGRLRSASEHSGLALACRVCAVVRSLRTDQRLGSHHAEGNNSSRKLQVYCWSTQKLAANTSRRDGYSILPGIPTAKTWLTVAVIQTSTCGKSAMLKRIERYLGRWRMVSALLLVTMESCWPVRLGARILLMGASYREKLCSGRHAMHCLQFSPDDSRVCTVQRWFSSGHMQDSSQQHFFATSLVAAVEARATPCSTPSSVAMALCCWLARRRASAYANIPAEPEGVCAGRADCPFALRWRRQPADRYE